VQSIMGVWWGGRKRVDRRGSKEGTVPSTVRGAASHQLRGVATLIPSCSNYPGRMHTDTPDATSTFQVEERAVTEIERAQLWGLDRAVDIDCQAAPKVLRNRA